MSGWTKSGCLIIFLFCLLFILASIKVNEQMLHDQYAAAASQKSYPPPSSLRGTVPINTSKDGVIGYLGFGKDGKVTFVGSKDFWWGAPEMDDLQGNHTISVYGGHLLPLLNKVAYHINYDNSNTKIRVYKVEVAY